MKAIVVISCEVPDPENLPTILEHIDPLHVPYFAGQVRIAVDEPDGEQIATRVLDYLDDGDEL